MTATYRLNRTETGSAGHARPCRRGLLAGDAAAHGFDLQSRVLRRLDGGAQRFSGKRWDVDAAAYIEDHGPAARPLFGRELPAPESSRLAQPA